MRKMTGANVRFLGWQSDEVIRDYLRRCRALLFPGEEDFGIVPVEAMACGAPVIAFGKGGATETVIPSGGRREPTGVFFAEQTVDCLCDAMLGFEAKREEFIATAARRQGCASMRNAFVRSCSRSSMRYCAVATRRRGARRDDVAQGRKTRHRDRSLHEASRTLAASGR